MGVQGIGAGKADDGQHSARSLTFPTIGVKLVWIASSARSHVMAMLRQHSGLIHLGVQDLTEIQMIFSRPVNARTASRIRSSKEIRYFLTNLEATGSNPGTNSDEECRRITGKCLLHLPDGPRENLQ